MREEENREEDLKDSSVKKLQLDFDEYFSTYETDMHTIYDIGGASHRTIINEKHKTKFLDAIAKHMRDKAEFMLEEYVYGE